MHSYLNVHDTLEARRQAVQAAEAGGGGGDGSSVRASEGPRVFVVGPTDSGKSSLCKILINYAGARGWSVCRGSRRCSR